MMIIIMLVEGYISPDKYITLITQTHREKVLEMVFVCDVSTITGR